MFGDIRNVFKKDPAAKSVLEVLTCYPGLHALWGHRAAHILYKVRLFVIARMTSHLVRWLTGIEIHPGAKIGKRFFIDHGMGVVIGETAETGDDCLIYQGVVLGGTTISKGKRHPTLGDNVTVGAGAIVLGPIYIGNGAKVGAGSVVLQDVPPAATVVGVPGRVGIGFSGDELMNLEHNKLPDPVADAIRFVLREQNLLEERLKKIEAGKGIKSKDDEFMVKKKAEIEKEFEMQKIFEERLKSLEKEIGEVRKQKDGYFPKKKDAGEK